MAGVPGALPGTDAASNGTTVLAKNETQAMLDSMDARAVSVVSRQIFRAPFTREKYLQYFRPLHYGERSVVQHGGNRGVEAKMAQELLQARHVLHIAPHSCRLVVEPRRRAPHTLTRESVSRVSAARRTRSLQHAPCLSEQRPGPA